MYELNVNEAGESTIVNRTSKESNTYDYTTYSDAKDYYIGSMPTFSVYNRTLSAIARCAIINCAITSAENGNRSLFLFIHDNKVRKMVFFSLQHDIPSLKVVIVF